MKGPTKTLKVAATGLTIAVAAMAIPALIAPFAGRPQSVLALFARSPDPQQLPEQASILGWQTHWARLDDVDPRTVRALYKQGALFVMPIRKSGCVSLRKT